MFRSLGLTGLLALIALTGAAVSAARLMENQGLARFEAVQEAVREAEASAQPNPEIEEQKRLAAMGENAPEEFLLGRLRHQDPFVRQRGVVYLGRHPSSAGLETVLAALNDEVDIVRLAAIDALLAWPGDDAYLALMNVVQLDPDQGLRLHAIATLRKFPRNPRVLSFLSETLLHPEPRFRWVAFAGLEEYERSMPAECRAVCLRRLDTTAPEIAKRLAGLLLNHHRDDPQVRQTLVQVMRRGNDAVITEAFALLSSDNPRDGELMIHALNACDDLGLAQGMLNSGNPKLSGVAREWAATHGVSILDRRGGSL